MKKIIILLMALIALAVPVIAQQACPANYATACSDYTNQVNCVSHCQYEHPYIKKCQWDNSGGGRCRTNGSCIVNAPLEYCGDGITQYEIGEECDDGDKDSGDGCSATCTVEFCGDTIVNNNNEQCEGPGSVNNIACSQEPIANCNDKHQQGTRDAYGDCNAQCGCAAPDPFENYQCVVEKCGAECAVADDCGAGNWDCIDCTCVEKPCIPECTGLDCGLDPVCGVECGPCTGNDECKDGQCVTPVCTNGQTQPCDYTGPEGTENVGACHAGIQTCSENEWGACVGEVTPVSETCDGLDDDCDGYVDNGVTRSCYTGAPETENEGICHAGSQTCEVGGAGTWGSCEGEVIPGDEGTACNYADDDCDGTPDDGLNCNGGGVPELGDNVSVIAASIAIAAITIVLLKKK